MSRVDNIKKESSEPCTRQVSGGRGYLEYIALIPDKDLLLSEISMNDLIHSFDFDCSEVLVSKIFRAGIYNNRIRGKNYVLFDEIFFEKTISGSELSSFSMYDTVESDNFSYRFDLLHVDALSNSLLLQNCVDTFNGAINHEVFPYNLDPCFVFDKLMGYKYDEEVGKLGDNYQFYWIENL